MPLWYVKHRPFFLCDTERMMKKSTHYFLLHCSVSLHLDPSGLAITHGKECSLQHEQQDVMDYGNHFHIVEGKSNYLYRSLIWSSRSRVLFSIQLYNWHHQDIGASFHKACGCWSLATLIDMSRRADLRMQANFSQQGCWLSPVHPFFSLQMSLELYFRCKSFTVSYLSLGSESPSLP